MILKMLPKRMWLFWLLLVLGLGLIFYLVLERGVDSTTTQQVLRREQALARAEASNIMTFFQMFGNSIAVFAQLASTEDRNANLVRNMDEFVDQWRDSGLIGGILLTDKEGVVQFNSNVLGTRDLGTSLSDRDYFIWAEEQSKEGEYFVGQPVVSRVGASKDKVVAVIVSPVYKNEIFTGVLAASVQVKPLTEQYFGLLRISDATRIYLINESGEILFNSFDEKTLGLNVFEPAPDRPFWGNHDLIDNFKSAISTSQEGRMRASYLNTISGNMEEHLVAYSPVLLGSQNWLLIMASPAKNVTNVTTPIYIRQTGILFLIYLTVLLFGLMVYRESKRQNKLSE